MHRLAQRAGESIGGIRRSQADDGSGPLRQDGRDATGDPRRESRALRGLLPQPLGLPSKRVGRRMRLPPRLLLRHGECGSQRPPIVDTALTLGTESRLAHICRNVRVRRKLMPWHVETGPPWFVDQMRGRRGARATSRRHAK